MAMFLFDRSSGLSLNIRPFKNKYSRGYTHLAPDGSGWRDVRLKNGKVKRTIIKGRKYNEFKNTLNKIMERNKMVGAE